MDEEAVALMNRGLGAARGLQVYITGGYWTTPQPFQHPQSFAVVGRAKEAQMSLVSSDVGFRHAYLQVIDGRVFCVDLGSGAPTFWGVEPCSCGWLSRGDVVRIGSYILQLPGDAPCSALDVNGRPLPNPLKDGLSDPTAFPRYELGLFDASLSEIVHVIDQRITLIGRLPICSVQLEDDSVSRVHCALVLTQDGLWLIDLLGKDGTRLDGKPVSCEAVQNGSELTVGAYSISVWRREIGPAACRD